MQLRPAAVPVSAICRACSHDFPLVIHMLRRTRIKICGITSVADAKAAADAGADAIGLVFYPGSPRHVNYAQAKEIAASLPPFVSCVGLFVDPTEAEVRDVIANVRVSMLQFHGKESAAFATQFSLPYIKAIRLGDGSVASVTATCAEHQCAQGFLLDTFDPAAAGGTGLKFDWSLFPADLRGGVLAGGLNPGNVAAALSQTNAPAVDVSSGVEDEPGVKNAKLINAFVTACRDADGQIDENTET